MPRLVDPPAPATPDQCRRMTAAVLLIKIIEHQAVHPGKDCTFCLPWMTEINRRMPKETP